MKQCLPLVISHLTSALPRPGAYQEAVHELHFVERLRPRNTMILFYTGMTFEALHTYGESVHDRERVLNEVRSMKFRKKGIGPFIPSTHRAANGPAVGEGPGSVNAALLQAWS